MKATPRCKICRREGVKLFLKGDRCSTSKCSFVKKKYPPGIHGPTQRIRRTEYGIQLREKQKLKRFFGISEKQLRNYFAKAQRLKGNSETNFLKLLEKRLDNVVYRGGIAKSRRQARQIVSHGNVLVNGIRLNIPSHQVKAGDLIKIKDKQGVVKFIKESIGQASKKDQESIPLWLSFDSKKLEIKVLKEISEESLPKEFNTGLIISFLSR
ncbi:30S ribosomal protein S4 [Patescibacteria group bacterium]|nr:30S ribosomal protein S4 [Patescibacteria group bacterium]